MKVAVQNKSQRIKEQKWKNKEQKLDDH
jgi:hypothetical protein